MATPDIERPERTVLKQIDHARFFEAIDAPPLPTEALRSAFRRAKTRSVPAAPRFPTTDTKDHAPLLASGFTKSSGTMIR